MRKRTQEGLSRIAVQLLGRGEDFFRVQRCALHHGPVGILNRRSVEPFGRLAFARLHGISSRGRSLTGRSSSTLIRVLPWKTRPSAFTLKPSLLSERGR